MLTRIRDQIGLELAEVYIESSIKPQRRSNRGYYLCNQAIKVLVIRTRDVEIPFTDVVDSIVVN